MYPSYMQFIHIEIKNKQKMPEHISIKGKNCKNLEMCFWTLIVVLLPSEYQEENDRDDDHRQDYDGNYQDDVPVIGRIGILGELCDV
jgi:hypothetical protein